MNIYVGNIYRTANEQDLKDAFAAFGEVTSSSIIKDKFSGESRGFGFVEMPTKEDAEKAIAGLNGKDLKGRPLTVCLVKGKYPEKSSKNTHGLAGMFS